MRLLKSTPLFLSAAFGLMIAATPMSIATAADDQDVAHYQGNGVLVNTFGNCVRTKWQAGTDVCSPPVAQAVPQPAPAPSPARQLQKEARTVYFEFNRSALLTSEQAKLDTLANVLKSDKTVRSVSIVGFADHMGTPTYNEKLSQRRAQTVEQYLNSRGYLKTSRAETRWLGESAPVTKCSDSLKREERIACLQKDRRVEVEIDFLTAAPAPAR